MQFLENCQNVTIVKCNIEYFNMRYLRTYLGKASFVLSLTASIKIMPSRTACLTLAPNSLLGKSKHKSISSLNTLATKKSLLSTQGFAFHLRNSVCTLGSTSKPKSLHSLSFSFSRSRFQSLSRISLSIGNGNLCSFTGESGGEFSRPYFKLKCDGDLHQNCKLFLNKLSIYILSCKYK